MVAKYMNLDDRLLQRLQPQHYCTGERCDAATTTQATTTSREKLANVVAEDMVKLILQSPTQFSSNRWNRSEPVLNYSLSTIGVERMHSLTRRTVAGPPNPDRTDTSKAKEQEENSKEEKGDDSASDGPPGLASDSSEDHKKRSNCPRGYIEVSSSDDAASSSEES